MVGSLHLPLLFLDVDGPLNPFAAKPTRRPPGYLTFRMLLTSMANAHRHGRRKPLRVWLNPDHGPQLRALPYELVWATTWTDEANEWIAPRLGLPQLEVVRWPHPRPDHADGLHFKTRTLIQGAAGRPFAWVDDEITDHDRAFIRSHHPGPALLHHVDARHGLRTDDFTTVNAWAAGLSLVSEPDPDTQPSPVTPTTPQTAVNARTVHIDSTDEDATPPRSHARDDRTCRIQCVVV